MRFLRRWRSRILLFFVVIGPGFITANVDNDANGIVTYSQAGAQFGYRLLWTMIPVTLALILVQEISARMGAVTGKGLSDLIREEFGLRITFIMMVVILLINFGNILGEFAGIAGSLELFGLSKYYTVPMCAVIVWLMVVKGQYKAVEKIFLVASFIYITYVFSGIIAMHSASQGSLGAEWIKAAIATIKLPGKELFEREYLFGTITVIGTTIAPWMQFYLQSSIVEKGVTKRQYRASQVDVIFGCIFTDVVAWFIIAACAATLYVHGFHEINYAKDAAEALRPLAGDYAYILFAVGLFNASLFAASILPLSTAYTVCEGLGFESGVGRSFREAPVFYWLYTLLIAAGAGLILVPNLPLIKIQLYSQAVNGVAIAPVLIFMLLLVNKKDLMGEFTNSRFYNIVAWGLTLVMTILSIPFVYDTVRQIIRGQ
jgi:NRAMP (natural resistance-associated macrophage protein)-like metal ion transporter